MIGAIIGDTVGSVYEFDNIKTKNFNWINNEMAPTDDSILTIATADWIMNGGEAWRYYVAYASMYDCPKGDYGEKFSNYVTRTITSGISAPYNSCGNGSAMRVSPIGWAFNTREEVLAKAKESAECTHNHPESIKGAQAVALAIFMARKGARKDEIKMTIESEFHYNLDFNLDSLRPEYSWAYPEASLCQGTVPQAIRCVLEASDFEDAIRNAVSLGGDSDTLACIAGGIAEPMFGIPKKFFDIETSVLERYFSEPLQVICEFEKKYGNGVLE
ncbi:MAG: ADP-ribosylglycohydrolase family protein [Fibrobacter sp.]|uniref:ADP-ribosylglycohydrolase family protein n=1 Tax=Fibrobacter sp. TaxID=35828 RepID=UPI002A90A508|nr:ADP-ribosylglycohydrolase family protein [Fibrobacter sp.]MDY6265008.1 ADP-ribosylglycohydrolase family protein [Fibrobacter sp.]